MSQSQDHGGLRLLSLDGGGIRGLSELIILRHLMERIQFQENLEEMPLPCDYFDLIGGTSTGGIIALMLGRLRMSVTKAIESYGILAEKVFSDVKRLGGDGKFKASKLEEVIKTVVKEQTGNADERMMDTRPQGQRCKTFVCAMAALDMSASIPRLFRTYQAPENQTFNCTIWEAARATSAAPTFFKRIVIGGNGSSEPFIDGGLGCNNPISQVLEEARLIFSGRQVACVVSIGTGQAQTIGIPEPSRFQRVLPLDVIEAIRGIATDCARTAQEIAHRFQDTTKFYFRFNVENGLQDVGLSQWDRLVEVTAHTEQYTMMSETGQKLRDAVTAIRERPKVIPTANISGMVRSSAPQRPRLKRCPPPTRVFTGRQDILDRMSQYFSRDIGKQQVFVLHGLGGAGKSQIAFKFVEMYQAGSMTNRFSDVFFVDASTPETIVAELKDIAVAKGLGDSATDTLNWFVAQREEWLLLLNNADDTSLNLRSYFPPCSHGNILITTRNHELIRHATGTRSSSQVSSMDPCEARDLLLEVAGLQEEHTMETDGLATEIVKELGHLALAVVQAGAYICSSECGLSRYLDLYRQRHDKLLQAYDDDVQKIDEYQWTVYTTWRISYDRLSPPAATFLELCAFLHHDGISEAIFQNSAANLNFYLFLFPEAVQESDFVCKTKDFLGLFRTSEDSFDTQEFQKLIKEVRSYSLIDFVAVNQTYSIHPLVHTWTRTMISNCDSTRATVQCILGTSVQWESGMQDHAFARTLLPHIDIALQGGIAEELETLLSASFGLVYCHGGRWKEAEELQVRAKDGNLRMFGPNHLFTLLSMEALASTYWNLGRWREAEELQIHVIRDATQQSMPLDTVSTVSKLALTYWSQGRWREAEELQIRVRDALQRVLPPDHLRVLSSMADLAMTYSSQGRWKEAEELEIRVKDARQQVLGLEHPDTLSSMANLAVTYRNRKHWKEAEELQIQVKDVTERVFGPDHPNTLTNMLNLALTYGAQERWKEAEELQIHAKDAFQRVLGPEDSRTLSSMHHLAATYKSQARWNEAEAEAAQALDGRQRVLGLAHPDTMLSMEQLATIYLHLGRQEEMQQLMINTYIQLMNH